MSKNRIKATRDILSQAIMTELKAYETEIMSRVEGASDKNAKKLKKILKETSPELTGDYKKGWRVKKVDRKTNIVHNATDWQLTHLLEEGHFINDGTHFVQPIPHITPARDKIEKEFMSEVEEAIKKSGN